MHTPRMSIRIRGGEVVEVCVLACVQDFVPLLGLGGVGAVPIPAPLVSGM